MGQQPSSSAWSSSAQQQPTSTTTTGVQQGPYLSQETKDIARGAAVQTRNRLTQFLCWAYCTLRDYSYRYPPLGAFIVSLTALGAIPTGIFVTITGFSLGTMLTIAAVIISTVQGGILAVGGTILLAVLAAVLSVSAFITTGVTFLWGAVSVGRFGMRVLSGQAPQQYGAQRQYYPSFSWGSRYGTTQYQQQQQEPQASMPIQAVEKMEELRRAGEEARRQEQVSSTTTTGTTTGTSRMQQQHRPGTSVVTSP